MGIPRLTAHLRPYAQSTTFKSKRKQKDANGPKTSTAEPAKAVVDGPGLAYWAYYRALSLRSTARNALEGAPSYAEVGRVAVAWVDMLVDHGFEIVAIYFDGALPVEKQETRLARLDGSLKQLTAFQTLHGANIPLSSWRSALTEDDIRDLATAYPIPAKLKALPPPPFMVPAAIGVLQESRYGNITSVIGGEADVFCASIGAREGAYIFTGDSDLLVHNLDSSEASVVFYQDLQLSSTGDGESVLSLVRYKPKEIAAELGLTKLMPFAYALKSDPHRSIAQCVETAKQQADDAEYATFKKGYSENGNNRNSVQAGYLSTMAERDSQLKTILERMDPRISELLWRGGNRRFWESHTSKENMYLPFLIDDPSRASAWAAGRDMRCIAYALLDNSISDRNSRDRTVVAEFERRGPRIAPTRVVLPPNEELPGLCSDLAEVIGQWLPADKVLGSVVTHWRAVALHILLLFLTEDKKQLPSAAELVNLLRGQTTGTNWVYIHFSAQLQAVLYSLRMLQQIIQVFHACKSHHGLTSEPLHGSIARLTHHLSYMPSLRALFPTMAVTSNEAEQQRTSDELLVTKLLDSVGVQEDEEFKESSSKKKKKKRKKDEALDDEHEPVSSSRYASSNVFSLLANG